jgi:predicted enzyme related to lactoylglutathione lyase
MANILGIGGLFYKAADPAATRDWYARVFGLEFADWGGVVFRPETAAAHPGAGTVFCPFDAGTDHFKPSTATFMLNLMVDDLDATLARCAEHGIEPIKLFPDEGNGRFAHVMGPDGLKIELWEPKPMS